MGKDVGDMLNSTMKMDVGLIAALKIGPATLRTGVMLTDVTKSGFGYTTAGNDTICGQKDDKVWSHMGFSIPIGIDIGL
jgi:hypothetical protein